MERSEPALAPEWLRCSGSVTGGSTLSHHPVSSSLHSDNASSISVRNRSRSSNDRDSQHPFFLERSSSSNSRRASANNGSAKHPYSSFTRNHRERNHEKGKERSVAGEFWDHDPSGILENILTSCVEKSSLRRSQSLAPKRTSEGRPEDMRNGAQDNQYSGSGILFSGSDVSGIKKASFDKDFPSLGAEEKLVGSGIVRVSSPVLSTAVQNLPIGTSQLRGCEKWTSALAEVPATTGTKTMVNTDQPNVVTQQQSALVTPSSGANTLPGLNMAEALSQASPRMRTAPQVPDKNQRLEELAKKQSKQLIPVTPSFPKALVSNSSEKSKLSKGAVRTTDSSVARSMQQQQLQYSNQQATQARGGQVKSDGQSSSHVGKFLVLKSSRENGSILTAKDTLSPTNNSNGKVANGQLPLAPIASTVLTSSNIVKAPTLEKKVAALTLHARPMVEKKLSFSQAQSRSDFFNLMRKKTSLNNSSSLSDSSAAGMSLSGKANRNNGEDISSPVSYQIAEKFDQPPANGGDDGHNKAQSIPNAGDQNMCLSESAYPDEEEAAFLRSLGWEENAEDEGLTEEEINAFYEECMKLRPSIKVGRGIQPKGAILSESHSCNLAGSSESCAGGSEYEA